MIDPAIESYYQTGYEQSRLFPGGTPSLEYVRSVELLERLLPAPPASPVRSAVRRRTADLERMRRRRERHQTHGDSGYRW